MMMNTHMVGASGANVDFTLENNEIFGRLGRPSAQEMRNGSTNAS